MTRYRAVTMLTGIALAATAAACSGSPLAPLDGGGAPGDPPAAAAAPPAAPASVLPDGDAAAQALAVSQALWREAPVAVLAPDGDPAALQRATAVAARVPAPLLLVSTGNVPAVAAELDRMGTEEVVADGVAAAVLDPLTAAAGVEILGAGEEPPRVELAESAEGTVVLVPAAEAIAAAGATAAAAGAAVVPVAGGDPRADPAAIRGLAGLEVGAVLALGAAFGDAEALRRRVEVAATGVELPGGGQTLFPGRRLVALYGHPGTSSLGVLGEQDPQESVERARALAADYQPYSGEPVVPAFEIIATIASAAAGSDGDYSSEASLERLRPYVDAAAGAGVYVVLDLQPGRTDFLTQARRYEELLRLPHVGLALDPEWRLKPDQVHLAQTGSVGAAEINEVAGWLAGLVREDRLPQKLLLLHQFRRSMISDREAVDVTRDEVAVLVQMDGDGVPAEKLATWEALKAGAQQGLWFGWKNFYDEDSPTFTPEQTLAVQPTPWWVSYQ